MVVIGTAAVSVGTFSGVAYASNGAAPGDLLYAFDLALENVGIGDGGFEERLAEAAKLMNNGLVDEGLSLAASVLLGEQGDSDAGTDGLVTEEEESAAEEEESAAAEGLLTAADAVLSEGSDESLAVRTNVVDKLTFIAETELEGSDFGQAVADLARDITSDAEDDGPELPAAATDNEKPATASE